MVLAEHVCIMNLAWAAEPFEGGMVLANHVTLGA